MVGLLQWIHPAGSEILKLYQLNTVYKNCIVSIFFFFFFASSLIKKEWVCDILIAKSWYPSHMNNDIFSYFSGIDDGISVSLKKIFSLHLLRLADNFTSVSRQLSSLLFTRLFSCHDWRARHAPGIRPTMQREPGSGIMAAREENVWWKFALILRKYGKKIRIKIPVNNVLGIKALQTVSTKQTDLFLRHSVRKMCWCRQDVGSNGCSIRNSLKLCWDFVKFCL